MSVLANPPRVEVKPSARAHDPASTQAGPVHRSGTTAPAGTPGAPGTLGPLRRVVAALEAGAESRVALARVAGLDPDVVDSALEHLVRLGRVRLEPLGAGCPSSGCGSCPSGPRDGSDGCAVLTPSAARGPVAVTLVGRPPG
jgi:hypothetical protein